MVQSAQITRIRSTVSPSCVVCAMSIMRKSMRLVLFRLDGSPRRVAPVTGLVFVRRRRKRVRALVDEEKRKEFWRSTARRSAVEQRFVQVDNVGAFLRCKLLLYLKYIEHATQ
ncbi:hypothetical protein MTO96_019282 [Rhipicephalus appendiculatus]